MAFQKFYNENVIILDIPNAILWTFIILTCDYKSEPKIFYVLHISLEAKKNVLTYTESSIISWRKLDGHNVSS